MGLVMIFISERLALKKDWQDLIMRMRLLAYLALLAVYLLDQHFKINSIIIDESLFSIFHERKGDAQ